jgi:uncharacterized protein
MGRWIWAVAVAMMIGDGGVSMAGSPYAVMDELTLGRVEIEDGFWSPRREQLRAVVLPTQWENLEANHHVDNFRVQAGVKPGVQLGPVYIDSDLYKWIEAASYVAGKHPDDEWLRGRLDEITGLIEKSQAPDGYLDTYYQAFAPDRRFRLLWNDHELYCAGHFFEAACASDEATGDQRLMTVARRYADLLTATFGPGMNEGVPGHEEAELALVRMYRRTGEPRCLGLADFFIHQRGQDPHYHRDILRTIRERAELTLLVAERRRQVLGDGPAAKTVSGLPAVAWFFSPGVFKSVFSGRYYQADRPLLGSTAAVGHSVRAMYLYTGAADLYLETGEKPLLDTLDTVWTNTISRRTYVTGGMGSRGAIEGFGRDYELPHRSYAETCAAIGSFFFNWRMLRATGEARFAEQMERTLYNAVLPGIGLDGRSYFYVNTLAAHGRTERQPWFGCACCPPNLARLFGSLERYLYARDASGIWVHQYVGGTAQFDGPFGRMKLEMKSAFPWEGRAEITVREAPAGTVAARLRIPAWSERSEVKVNGAAVSAPAAGSYLTIARQWRSGDVVALDFAASPRLILGSPQVSADRGRAAIAYGPLIYCVESVDNPGVDVHSATIAAQAPLRAERRPDLLGGIDVIKTATVNGRELTAVPYYAWANRGVSDMEVWLKVR